MSLGIKLFFSMFCIFPAIVGIYKYKRVDKLFYPFIVMMWLEVFVEPIDFLSKKIQAFEKFSYTIIDIYTLLNFFLFSLLTLNFNIISKTKFKILIIISTVIGIINFIHINYLGMTFYSLFFVSLSMLAISMDILTKQIMAIKQPLQNNFWFWMSGTLVIYNAQLLLIFCIYFFAVSNKILGNIFNLVNAGCYILLGIAMLKMPENLYVKFKKT